MSLYVCCVACVRQRDEAISFLNTAILRIQEAAPRAVRMADRIKHELSTRSVLVHMCSRAGRYELAVEEASKAVRRAKELDSGLEDARNDLRLVEDVAARMVAISTVEEHVAEREEAVRLEERRTTSLSAIDLTCANVSDAGMKTEPAEVRVSVESVIVAIPVLLSAVRELHKLSELHVANAGIGVRPMESFERALQAAEKAITMQRLEVSKLDKAVALPPAASAESRSHSHSSFMSDVVDEPASFLASSQRSAYDSLLDSLSRSYAHYGNIRLSFFRQTTMDKSDSSQLRRWRQLTLHAFEQAASTATTPLLRAYMMSRLAEVQFNSAVEHGVVMSTLRQALHQADRGGLVLMKERVLQQTSSAIDEEEEAVARRSAVTREEQKTDAIGREDTATERAELMSHLHTVQRLKEDQRGGLGKELAAIRQLDDEFMLAAEEDGNNAPQEEEEGEKVEQVVVDDEVDARYSERKSSRRRAATVRKRPSVTRKARETLQAGRQAASSDSGRSTVEAVMLLSEDEEEEEDDLMDGEDDDNDDAYEPTCVDSRSPTESSPAGPAHSAALSSPARVSSPALTPRGRAERRGRPNRRMTSPSSPSPPPAATHYDADDSDVEDVQLVARTAQVISAMHDIEEKKVEDRLEGARLMRTANKLHSHSPSAQRDVTTRRKRRRSSQHEQVRPRDDDLNFIVEDRVDNHGRDRGREHISSVPRAIQLYPTVPSRRSMREMNASGQPWRAVCAQLLADRERSRADEQGMTHSQILPTRGAGSNGSRVSHDRASSTGSRSSQQRGQTSSTATQPRRDAHPVGRELDMFDAESETVTTRTETQYVGDGMDIHFEQSPPRSQPQSQSLPLAQHAANGPPHPTYSDPVVAYRPLRSVSLPRHSVRYEAEDVTDVMPLVAGADDRSQSLTDEELGAISMLTLVDEFVQHIQRRTGRICVVSSISHRGEMLGADHTALHVFQRHQRRAGCNELPLLSIVLDRWKAVTLLDCYRTLCQTSSNLRIHPLVLHQLYSSVPVTTIQFRRRPPPTLDSATLQPLFHALRVEPGVLTSLCLPPLPLQSDAAAAFARSICYTQATTTPLSTRLAYLELFPHSTFPPPPTNQQLEPLPHALVQLSHVSLSGVMVASTHFSELVASFGLLPSLTDLDLSDTLLTDDCLPGLCFLVQHSNSISRLNLSRSLFTASEPTHRNGLIAALAASKCLTHLNLSHCHLSLESTTALLPSLVRMQHLDVSSLHCLQPNTSTDLSSSAVNSTARLSSFYSTLYRQLTSLLCRLTVLVLHHVTDVVGQLSGVVCLALAAPTCRLQCVELCNNGLSPPGVHRLLAVVTMRNTTLRRLVLDGNRAVSDEAACKQLLRLIGPTRLSADRGDAEVTEEMQTGKSAGVRGPVDARAVRTLQELSVRQCGLSLSSRTQLLMQITNTHAVLKLHL